jgi:hypothetical protein
MAIPGVTTKIRDRFYSISRQDAPVGPRVVAMARRSTADGTGGIADLDVVRASNEADVITAFGEGSDAHRAFIELVIAGAERIFLVPLPSNTIFNHTTGAITSGGTSIFDAAFNAAEAALPDIIVPWGRGGHPDDWEDPATPGNDAEYGFHADNSSTSTTSWAYKVGLAAKTISENTNPCIAILGVKPYLSTAEKMTPGQVSTHLGLADLVDRDSSDLFKEVGPYLSVVAAEVKPVNYNSGTIDFGYTNGACFLAGTLSRLPSYSSVVNKPLYNVDSVRYAPTRTQQGSLGDKGINTVIINFNRIAVFGEALTFAQSTSDYIRLTTKRIVDEATLVVRQVCQKFIGEPSNIQVRNSMETAITSGLRGMQLMGALLGSDFSVAYLPNQNKAIVDLVLTPAFELKTIEVQVAISL